MIKVAVERGAQVLSLNYFRDGCNEKPLLL